MTTEAQWVLLCVFFYLVGGLSGFLLSQMQQMWEYRKTMDQLIKRGKRDLQEAHSLLSDLRSNGHG